MPINYVSASGKDIAELVERIESAVDGNSSVNVSIACLVVAILAQNPEIGPERLQTCIRLVSELLAASIFDEVSVGAAS